LTPGGVQNPARIEGGAFLGPQIRITKANLPLGAGCQLASFPFPGDGAARRLEFLALRQGPSRPGAHTPQSPGVLAWGPARARQFGVPNWSL